MKTFLQFHEQAEFLRESSGSTNIEKTLLKAVKVLAFFHIPYYVCRGFAVQEHGYPRFTVDVDIIVLDVQLAQDNLWPFKRKIIEKLINLSYLLWAHQRLKQTRIERRC